MTTCNLEVTQQEWDDIKQCEAVVIREYERADDGSRFAEPVAWGDADEMRDKADTPSLLIVPVGLQCVAQTVVLVEELLQ